MGQDVSSPLANPAPTSINKWLSTVTGKITAIDNQVQTQTNKYLKRLSKKEQRLKAALYETDSVVARKLPSAIGQDYCLQTQTKIEGKYNAYLDSLKTGIAFLESNGKQILDNPNIKYIKEAKEKIKALEDRLQVAEELQKKIQSRKDLIKQFLSQYATLPKGITKYYTQYSKELFYYREQIQEYKNILKDPQKIEKQIFAILNQLPAFTSFFKKYSQLASLFSLPSYYGSQDFAVSGLQTRDQITQYIQNTVASAGPNASQLMQGQLQGAQSAITCIQDRIAKLGASGADLDLPDFVPNEQKKKSFLKRLEYGTSFQTQKSNYYFPTTSDLALSVGYKLNEKSILGIGCGYKIGLGNGWNNIRFSHQGASLRSFLDYKIKGSFFASGGFEYNYQPPNDSTNAGKPPEWTKSGLLGISKIVSLKSKVFKRTKLQLLWDFLSYQQPQSQPIKFRVGYTF